MELIYLKQNSKRGSDELRIYTNKTWYPAPKFLLNTDIWSMEKSIMSGFAICRRKNIEPTLNILNYISKIETKILNDKHKYELENLKSKIKKEKIKCILNRYIGTEVYVYNVISSYHYDYDFKIYSDKPLDICVIKEKFKNLGEAQSQVKKEILSIDLLFNGYYFLNRYKIDLIDKPY